MDFQKAFDKVPHQRLILKLKSHGMGNSIINWIEQWLNAAFTFIGIVAYFSRKNINSRNLACMGEHC